MVRPPSQTFSTTSAHSVIRHGTMEQRLSSVSPKKRKDTPEWRRRIIKGQVGYGDQTDLFGPSGLENIFQQPARPQPPRPHSEAPPGLAHFGNGNNLPSSPPPWPSEVQLSSPGGTVQAFKTNLNHLKEEEAVVKSLGSLDSESDREEMQVSTSTDVHGAARKPPLKYREPTVELPSIMEWSSLQDESDKVCSPPGVPGAVQNRSPVKAFVEDSQSQTIGSRVASGQTELRNEEFSPVYISKHNSTNGQVDYAPLDASSAQVTEQLKRLAIRQSEPDTSVLMARQQRDMQLDSSLLSHSRRTNCLDGHSIVDMPEISLPDNLPAGTPDAVDMGGFVNVKRGGYSNDGSFRRRPLSPSPSKNPSLSSVDGLSQLSRGTQLKASPLEPDISKSTRILPVPSPPEAPRTPNLSPQRQYLSPERTRSGSPLKLFGNHDTFTSNKLRRRMSQLEDTMRQQQDNEQAQDEADVLRKSSGISRLQLNSVEEVSFQKTGGFTGPEDAPQAQASSRLSSFASNFGEGELDAYSFAGDFSLASPSHDEVQESENDRSSSPIVPPPGSRTPFRFQLQSSPGSRDTFRSKRKLSRHTTVSTVTTVERDVLPVRKSRESTMKGLFVKSFEEASRPQQHSSEYTEGKRPPTSPFKDPAPKRRRTLHASELLQDLQDMHGSIGEPQNAVQPIIGRKRKEARFESHSKMADSCTIANRHILRPRNPTPSQRRREQIQAEIREATEDFMASSPDLEVIQKGIDLAEVSGSSPAVLQAKAVAGEVAAFTLKMAKKFDGGERKRSVTTQDFLDEAMRVMEFIRAVKRPQSGLASVGEAEAEGLPEHGSFLHPRYPGGAQDSMRLSRPPSREGGNSGWRSHGGPQQLDARVMSHLRKFEEKDDVEFMASSFRSLHVRETVQHLDPGTGTDMADEPQSHIRITEPLSRYGRERGDSNASQPHPDSVGTTVKTQSSYPSVGTSSSRTIGTSSTRKSDVVATLAPETVAHLIPEEVAGMCFDREKGVWIKNKSINNKPKCQQGPWDLSSVGGSEDDPLGKIPDLTVDEVKELNRIQCSPSNLRNAVRADATDSEVAEDQAVHITEVAPASQGRTSSEDTVVQGPVEPLMTRNSSEDTVVQRSSTRDNLPPVIFGSSTAQSRHSQSLSVGPQVETRATSWSEHEMARRSQQDLQRAQHITRLAPIIAEEEAEHTIKINEGRNTGATGTNEHQPRGVSISFSSPLAPRTQAFTATRSSLHDIHDESDATELTLDTSEGEDELRPEYSGLIQLHAPRTRPLDFAREPVYCGSARQPSLRRQTFAKRPLARVDDPSEFSIIAAMPDKRTMSLSVSVSAPMVPQRGNSNNSMVQPSTPCTRADVTLYLSPLQDFTIHQVDKQRPSEHALATRLASHVASEVDDPYALHVKQLVQRLTEVEGDELYWDEIRDLDLQARSLSSLCALSDLCPKLQELDVSGNALGQLDGTPVTTRVLSARSNLLSGLTSWGHLMNLQYLDVSGNDIDSLWGFSSLVHLRELRADDNKVSSLEGVLELDGLLKLRLRRNKLESINFEGTELKRLTDLDLAGNALTAVDSLECLPELTYLNLDHNQLACFPSTPTTGAAYRKLKMLKICDNQMTHLTVLQHFPSLRVLLADRNRLSYIPCIKHLEHLQVLSVREQDPSQDEGDIGCFYTARGMEHSGISLYSASATPIPTLKLETKLYGLKHLELASCGLQILPADFAQQVPGLRYLNLNFNALQDLRPLLNITNLQDLHLAGNRLSRLRKSMAVLSRMKELKVVDMRGNPYTVGFYPPTSEMRLVSTNLDENDDTSETDEALPPDPYLLPPANTEENKRYWQRLDEDTKLRRRVYELLLADFCRGLKTVDGLDWDRGKVQVKDGTWQRLMELGLVKDQHVRS
ncbi:hypothetical protein LTR04_005238 [Oleoguttula sp. CCFEE 6159]|nr:hypothetical protein LTR04_005238 [Oleoguttula sp. CCFEE 6159]